jgi:DNA-binding transcriptional LysR family regulator
MLNLHQLEAFVAIVDTKSFRGAGSQLGRSQPTITQQLRKLEEDLGVSLIVRDRSMSVPTVQGSRLLPLARRLLKVAARTEDLISGRRVVVGASSNIGIYLLQPFLFRYSQEQNSAVDIQIASNPEIAERLASGELDLAVMEWWDQRSGFSSRLWRREKLVVIVNPDHPWARRKAVPSEALFEEPMIGGESGTGTGTLLQKLFGKKASRMRISRTLGSTEGVKAAVKAGLGVSLVFESAVAEEVSFGSLKALDVAGVKINKELFVILPDETPAQAPARNFAGLLLGNRTFGRA